MQSQLQEPRASDSVLNHAQLTIAASAPIAILEVITSASIRIARWNAVCARSERYRRAKRQRIQHWFPSIDAGGSLKKWTDILGTEATYSYKTRRA